MKSDPINENRPTEYKLHLALDKPSYARLLWLKGALQAASFGEVLRRALSAYEIFDPDDLPKETGGTSDLRRSVVAEMGVEHLYIVLTAGVKEQLNDEKATHGRAYKETVSRALCVLTQLVREREKLIAEIKKGDEHENENENPESKIISESNMAIVFGSI